MKLSHVLALLLGVVGCRPPQPAPPHATGAGFMTALRRFEQVSRGRDLRGLGSLLSPHCRSSCRGFIPFIISRDGGYEAARWMPRLEDRGNMLQDLARILLSYQSVELVSLAPLSARVYTGRARLRALLTLSGVDIEDYRRTDQGLVDLELRRTLNSWQIHDMRPVWVHALRRGDPAYATRPLPASRALGSAPMAVLDVDVDGDIDLVISRDNRVLLLRREGDRFAPARPLLTPEGCREIRSLRAADIDGDGDSDLFVGCNGGESRAYLNHRERFAAAGMFEVTGNVTDAVLTDIDSDGSVDLFAVRRRGEPSLLLWGQDRGLPESSDHGWGEAACAADLDNDGDQDLLVTGGSGVSRLLINDKGRLVRATRAVGLDLPEGTTACAVGDVDGDGRIDLFAGGRGDLWLNRPNPAALHGFVLKRANVLNGQKRVRRAGFLDHDADGDLDLLVLHGDQGAPGLFINLGLGQWADGAGVAALSAAAAEVAVHDFDADGDLDLVLGAVEYRWQGEGALGHSVVLRLEASGSNRDGLGSRVELVMGDRRQVREAGHASGLPGGPPGYVHFGIGEEVRAQQVSVRWPDGTRQSFVDLPVDVVVKLRQGGSATWAGQQEADTPTESTDPDEVEPEPSPAPDASGGLLPRRLLDLTLVGRGGPQSLAAHAGSKATLVLIAPKDCPGCSVICSALGEATRRPGVRALVLHVDEEASFACNLPRFRVTDAAARALAPGRSLWPGVALIDSAGAATWLLGGAIDRPGLEALLDRIP